MNLEENPLLKQEDYLKPYREKVEDLKHDPKLVSMDKLCYELFVMNEQGKQFLSLMEDRYLIPALVDRHASNYGLLILWSDGFKDAFRMIKQHILSHQQRIEAEALNVRSSKQ